MRGSLSLLLYLVMTYSRRRRRGFDGRFKDDTSQIKYSPNEEGERRSVEQGSS